MENGPETLPGFEDGEEFDEARAANLLYCQPISVDEYEDQAETETQKAINVCHLVTKHMKILGYTCPVYILKKYKIYKLICLNESYHTRMF